MYTDKKSWPDGLREQIRMLISDLIAQLRKTKWTEATAELLAERLGTTPQVLSDIVHHRRLPKWELRLAMARYWDVPIWAFFPKQEHFWLQGEEPVRWLVRLGLSSKRLLARRNVTEAVLRGESPAKVAGIAKAGADAAALRRAEDRIPEMVRGAFEVRAIELVTPDLDAVQDLDLGRELGEALSKIARRRITAHVVRNVAHPDFPRDPIVPLLIARVAHREVGRCLDEHHPVRATIGIGSGIHIAAFVDEVGMTPTPLADAGDRHLTLLPLMLEPLNDPRYDLSSALVSRLYRRTASLLGEARVRAPGLTPFGDIGDGDIRELYRESTSRLRDEYLNIDVVVLGCGDQSAEGSMRLVERRLGLQPTKTALSDVCGHFLGPTGDVVPYTRGHQPFSVPIGELQRLAADPKRLALLLASGASKGVPLTLVVRAGCADTVVCDAAAARAALTALATSS